MQHLRFYLIVGILWFSLPTCDRLAAVEAEETTVELKVIKYDELIKEIESLKGKVVVVDFWADT
jgi:hypothetical protein